MPGFSRSIGLIAGPARSFASGRTVYRFRLHRRDLPGKPDIVLPRHRLAVQVHGCFWHQHEGCKLSNVPRTRRDYWLPKLARNVERDAASATALEALGWRVAIIWECEAGDAGALRDRLETAIRQGG